MPRTVAVLIASMCALIVLPASAVPPTVGGPKGGSLPISFTATGPQQHFLAETAAQGVDPGVSETCTPPRCYAFPFTLAKPNKTAKTMQVSAQIKWFNPASRFWLHLMDVSKTPTSLGDCFSFYVSVGPSATVEARMPIGRKLALWVDVEQVAGASEPVKGSLSAPARHQPVGSPLTKADPTGYFLASCEG